MQRECEQTQAKMHDQRQAALSSNINGNFHSLEAHPSQACLSFAVGLEACLILAKSLLCCNFHSRGLPCGLPPPSQVSVLHFRSIPISIASRPASRPAILAKCLFCSTFHSINGSFHSLPRGLAACLILAKCLFCSTFHRIHGNVHSLDHPSQVFVLLYFLSHPWQFP